MSPKQSFTAGGKPDGNVCRAELDGVEFEQKEKERAQYGDKLLKRLEDAVNQKGLTVTLFQWTRKFYKLYPQIEKLYYVSGPADIQKSASVMHQFISSPEAIISRLSFTHLREIMSIDDPLVRYFYEQECMRCTWSVRELRRQIGTNLHIRVGLSKNPEKCLSPYKNGSDCAQLQIRRVGRAVPKPYMIHVPRVG